MVQQVGLNTATTNVSMPFTGSTNMTSLNPASIFSSNGFSTSGNNYQNDIMMKNLNFSAIAQAMNEGSTQNAQNASQNIQTKSAAQNQQTSFGNTEDEVQKAMAEYLKQQNSVSNIPAQEAKKSSIGKILGLAAGFLAPLAGKAVKLFQGGSFKELFKLKELTACPILGVVGLGAGMLVDSCIDAHKENKASQQVANA